MPKKLIFSKQRITKICLLSSQISINQHIETKCTQESPSKLWAQRLFASKDEPKGWCKSKKQAKNIRYFFIKSEAASIFIESIVVWFNNIKLLFFIILGNLTVEFFNFIFKNSSVEIYNILNYEPYVRTIREKIREGFRLRPNSLRRRDEVKWLPNFC